LARPRQPPHRPAHRTAAGHPAPRGGRSRAPPGGPRRAHRGAEGAALMPASAPTILATSAGYRPHPRLRFGFGPKIARADELAAERGPRRDGPRRICNIGTASGDDKGFQRDMEEAAREAGYVLHHLSLFSQPNVEDVAAYLRGFDVLWVNGGSVVNLLAVWRAHGLPEILERLWQEGVVLAGISAGSICGFEGGVTDSFGPELAPVTNGLGILHCANRAPM